MATQGYVIPGTTAAQTALIIPSVQSSKAQLASKGVEFSDVLSGKVTDHNHIIVAHLQKLAADLAAQGDKMDEVIASAAQAEQANPGATLPGSPYKIADLIAFSTKLMAEKPSA
ncbi:hypothetical protein BV898_08993 [Hypsibius exemplaris]|uniref:Uncharacterized protein n=1 Tax=Hypsibius exemplaris TaxID=2072580 RepID=A0A1W0WNM7_HYPEX|nr:hypothetical protein BV898_08993 [Hypsibius exemplaris]